MAEKDDLLLPSFESLKAARQTPDGMVFDSKEIRPRSGVFLSKSAQEKPIVLIRVSRTGDQAPPDIELENILVRPAVIGTTGGSEPQAFYVLEFLGLSTELLKVFFEIAALLPNVLPKARTTLQTHKAVASMIELFSEEYREMRRSIAGLWGELFIIQFSGHQSEMVRAWHSAENENFDFYLANSVLEVKLSTKKARIHSVSHSQIVAHEKAKTFLVSILSEESSGGLSLAELKESILSELEDSELKLKFITLITRTAGSANLHLLEKRFSAELAVSSTKVFDACKIPQIVGEIPQGISNLKYDISLELSEPERLAFADWVSSKI